MAEITNVNVKEIVNVNKLHFPHARFRLPLTQLESSVSYTKHTLSITAIVRTPSFTFLLIRVLSIMH